ncbi:hypothetical protein ACQ4PT_061358 [Festuca glaucescens]
MAERAPFNNLDPATAGDAQRSDSDPRELDRCMEQMLSYIYANLPYYPLYLGQRFRPARAAPDRVDRISRHPRELRRDIVSRLPVKDAAHTAVLSWRWRTIWLSTPLVLIDSHLLPKGQGFPPTYSTNSQPITAAVSSILEAHPGPFSCVHLICSRMDSCRPQLARWLQLFAAKGVHDLVLVNRPWPLEVPLPAALFTITTLTRLYLGLWKLPGTAALRGASFPHLRELGILFVEMEPGDVDSLVARSPVLEILNILGCMKGLRLRLVSQSLSVRANLRFYHGEHRRGKGSMPGTAHPPWTLQTRRGIVYQGQDWRCPQAARFWIPGARPGPRDPRHHHHGTSPAPSLSISSVSNDVQLMEVHDSIL